jgi:hypothetical protein
VVQEIYSGHSWKAYNKLKSVITDPTMDVHKKYMSTYTEMNRAHVLACSNSLVPLKMEDHDRRWLVPKVTEQTLPPTYWQEFYRWLREEGGLGIIKGWAQEFDDYVAEGDHAPMTSAKEQLLAAIRTPAQQIAFDIGERAMELMAKKEEKIVLVAQEVYEHIMTQPEANQSHGRRETLNTIRKALKQSGLRELKRAGANGQMIDRFWVTNLTPNRNLNCYLVVNFNPGPVENWDQVKQYYWSSEILRSI